MTSSSSEPLGYTVPERHFVMSFRPHPANPVSLVIQNFTLSPGHYLFVFMDRQDREVGELEMKAGMVISAVSNFPDQGRKTGRGAFYSLMAAEQQITEMEAYMDTSPVRSEPLGSLNALLLSLAAGQDGLPVDFQTEPALPEVRQLLEFDDPELSAPQALTSPVQTPDVLSQEALATTVSAFLATSEDEDEDEAQWQPQQFYNEADEPPQRFTPERLLLMILLGIIGALLLDRRSGS